MTVDEPNDPKRTLIVERLLWAFLVGLMALVVTISGAWVSSMERRVSASEGKTIALEKDSTVASRDIAEMRADIKTILELLRRRP